MNEMGLSRRVSLAEDSLSTMEMSARRLSPAVGSLTILPKIFLWGVFTTIAPLTIAKHVDLHVICMGNAILTAKPAEFDTHKCPMAFSRSRWHQYKVIQPWVWSSICQSVFRAWFCCQGFRSLKTEVHWKLSSLKTGRNRAYMGVTWGLWPGIYLKS